jgi:hypothetical protein
VHYTLQGYGPASISLFLSFDNDHTWSKVVDDVSGDIGENVTPGEKVIVVHNMPIDGLANARFRIIVNNKETTEAPITCAQGETNTATDNPYAHQGSVSLAEENLRISETYAEAPTIRDKRQSENRKSGTQVRKENTTQQTQTQQEVSNNLNNAYKNIKGGSGTTTGMGQQGDPNGSINGRGVLGGGGSAGTGGGSGGGNGSGTGVGSGSGSGMSWKLDGRSIVNTPKVTGTAPDEGDVTVDIWVDANGVVTKAIANAAKSNTSNGTLFKMAEEAARKAKFSTTAGGKEQMGSIKIKFKLH